MHRQTQRLPLDVPQRQINGAHRVDFLAARRVEPFHVHLLPQPLYMKRALTDDAAGALFQCVLEAAFANAVNPASVSTVTIMSLWLKV